MSAITLQRPLLYQLTLHSHFQIAGPARFLAGSTNPRARQTLVNPSLLWGKSIADRPGRQNLSEIFFQRQVRLPWVCISEGGFQFAARRGLKAVKKSAFVRGEQKVVMEVPTVTARKRPTVQTKQLNLRQSGSHGNTFISYVQILGTGMDTRDTAPSVLLFFDKRRIIFNAGEGLQRFCIEHKIKLSKLDHVFLTRIHSETASGVPGLLLTLSNTGETGMAVNLWGPSDLHYLVDAMRTFIPGSSVVHTHSFGTEKQGLCKSLESDLLTKPDALLLLDDEVVKISAVLLLPDYVHPASSNLLKSQKSLVAKGERDLSKEVSLQTQGPTSSGSQTQDTSLPFAEPWELGFEREMTADQNASQKRPRLSVAKSAVLDESLKLETNGFPVAGKYSASQSAGTLGSQAVAAVYICELPEIIGKFDPEKAMALGLRPGRKYGQLQAGQSVVADNGKATIHPSDVMDPSLPGPICLVVDCPTVSYLTSLISSPAIKKFCPKMSETFGEGGKKVTCIIHIGPASVVNCSQYRAWMALFEGTQHLMAGHGMQTKVSPILKSSARIMSRLNFVCPQVFPIAGLQQIEDEMDICQEDPSCGLIATADNLLKFRLRPISLSPLDRTLVPAPLDISVVQQELMDENPALQDAAKTIADLWNALPQKREHFSSSDIVSSNKATSTNLTVQQSPLELPNCDNDLPEEFPACLNGVRRDELEIVFLGTGSSQPSKYRNVSSIYIHLFKRGGLLLDCGEGTYAQLKRRYGNKAADDILAGLKCVWISHIHADHHTGLVRILSVRKKVLENEDRFEPIVVVGPKQLKRYLDAYGKLEDLGMDFLDCSQTTLDADSASLVSKDEDLLEGDSTTRVRKPGSHDIGDVGSIGKSSTGLIRLSSPEKLLTARGQPVRSQLQNYWLQSGFNFQAGLDENGRKKLKVALCGLGLSQLNSVPVVHCPHAFGVVLVGRGKKLLEPGWRIVYSGDTRPCQALVEASKGATVLIHEATFDDAMPEEAIAKNHSLTREAIETGISAGAYRTILTHFSQRYPKIPVFNESYNNRTCIAFDMMSVNLADLPILPKLLPALKLLFKDEMMVAEEGGEVVDQS